MNDLSYSLIIFIIYLESVKKRAQEGILHGSDDILKQTVPFAPSHLAYNVIKQQLNRKTDFNV